MNGATSTGTDSWLDQARTSYDGVADAYADLVRGAATAHPVLSAALGMFARSVHAGGGGPIADLGCGPGDVTAALHDLGLDVLGIDISPAMIARARTDHPGLRFEVASITELDLPDSSMAGLLAWQSIIHLPDELMPAVFERMRRALRPGGVLQLLFHVGDEPWLKTEGYGGPMNVWVHPRPAEMVERWLEVAGFVVDAELHLAPRSARSQALVLATRPAAG